MILSGGLAMFDVYSDYAVLSALNSQPNSQGWFLTSAAIVGFAAIAVAFQLFRNSGATNAKTLIKFLVCLLSLVQAHWIILFGLILVGSDKAISYHTWYESTVLTEVVLESIPQLLLQTYIILSTLSDFSISRNSAQIVAILFSLVMAGKTIVSKVLQFKSAFKGPDQGTSNVGRYRWSTILWVILFSYSSLMSRSLMIVAGALGYRAQFFAALGIMFTIRFLKDYLPLLKHNPKQALLPTTFLSQIQSSVAAVFRDYWRDDFLAVLSAIEVGVIAYLLRQRIMPDLTVMNYPDQMITLLFQGLVAATAVRVLAHLVIKRLIKTNRAVYTDDSAKATAPDI